MRTNFWLPIATSNMPLDFEQNKKKNWLTNKMIQICERIDRFVYLGSEQCCFVKKINKENYNGKKIKIFHSEKKILFILKKILLNIMKKYLEFLLLHSFLFLCYV